MGLARKNRHSCFRDTKGGADESLPGSYRSPESPPVIGSKMADIFPRLISHFKLHDMMSLRRLYQRVSKVGDAIIITSDVE